MRIQFGVKNLTRAVAALSIGLAACIGLIGSGGQAQAGVPSSVPSAASAAQVSKIDPLVLQETRDGQRTSVMVLLTDQADLSAAHGMRDQDARGWYVYNTLRDHAERTQVGLRSYLKSQGVSFKPFWAANVILVEGGADRALVESLAARPDVKEINSNRPTRWIEDDEFATSGPVYPTIPNVPEWGVTNVNAPQVWAMGYNGQGMVVGGLDTGIRWTHNALRPQYRGWNGSTADHNYNWWDSVHSGGGVCGPNTQAPCDDHTHGSHTIGTAVGWDGGANEIGVAPGAKWMGCRNMNQGVGTPATYTECFQFTIAPTDLTGSNPNPALRPHVLVNSWGCPPSEGCTAGGELETIVNNTQAAGIFVQVSAGNSGPACGSVFDPPAIYEAAFSTGAYNISNALASFSSRGPVTRDGSNRLKPNISAPGVSVRSATNGSDTAYGSLQGTSMAGPHVSGVVALLWSARPQLVRDIATTKNVLQNSANPNITVSPAQTCNGIPHTQIPNNSFGYGRVDALAAVNSVSGGTPTATGTGTVPTATRTNTPPPPSPTTDPCQLQNYVIATATGTVVPGTNLIPGSNCDDCSVPVVFPFPVRLYGTSYINGNAISNGSFQFTTSDTTFTNACLPIPTFGAAIIPYFDDLLLTGAGQGMYTAVLGTAPNRTFVLEWRGGYFSGGGTANFSLFLPEGGSGSFYIIYGTVSQGNTSATVGVQSGTGLFTQCACNGVGCTIGTGVRLDFSLPACGSITPSPIVNTPTRTPTTTSSTPTTAPPTNTANPSNTVVPPTGTGTVAPPTPTCVPVGTTDVDIEDLFFDPQTVTIGVGSTVRWTNNGQLPHTSTSTTAVWDSGTLNNGDDFSFTFNTPGSYPYICSIHPAMTGTIVVTGGCPTSTVAVPTTTPGGPTNTPGAATATVIPCTITFTDVPQNHTFYANIRCLACRGVLGGYADGTFRPENNITRGQIAKVVSNAAGFSEPVSGQTYEDVIPTNTFYLFIERLSQRGHMGGYPCGLRDTEPCNPPENRPYFRPNENATRGQLSKIVSNAAGLGGTPTGIFYTDVEEDNPFYVEIMRLTNLGVMSGYPCGGVNPQTGQPEPCDDAQRPYFRWGNFVTRGQASKIVANTFFPACDTP